MKLKQGQIWKTENAYLLIVEWHRLAIAYQSAESHEALENGGEVIHVTKKEFCRLLKSAELVFEPMH